MILGIGTGIPDRYRRRPVPHAQQRHIQDVSLPSARAPSRGRPARPRSTKLGGLARAMPMTFIAMAVASLAISGVPPFNGFVSKWMVYSGTRRDGRARHELVLDIPGGGAVRQRRSRWRRSSRCSTPGFLGQRRATFAQVKEAPLADDGADARSWPRSASCSACGRSSPSTRSSTRSSTEPSGPPLRARSSLVHGVLGSKRGDGTHHSRYHVGLLVFSIGKLSTRRVGHIFIGGTKPPESMDAMHVDGQRLLQHDQRDEGAQGRLRQRRAAGVRRLRDRRPDRRRVRSGPEVGAQWRALDLPGLGRHRSWRGRVRASEHAPEAARRLTQER